ncbi:hypothetical protein WS75_06565 [Burkholderia sp. FL-7-2-10-S1-D7]|jgi:hypothetical protein|uniref:hypothetical protein n=1 Tax=Burkholderia sp. FL-7-2-10-S1-D7 TaxID=1637866 RepID=UPI00075344CE|nr:hypothetical protein [Burkholderia sp. FL-7-2-10-S1-D7]KVF77947.1 hypothetical protein WS75_06565 [Burkholderia sp. FL-7-2-10-S1-D7]
MACYINPLHHPGTERSAPCRLTGMIRMALEKVGMEIRNGIGPRMPIAACGDEFVLDPLSFD